MPNDIKQVQPITRIYTMTGLQRGTARAKRTQRKWSSCAAASFVVRCRFKFAAPAGSLAKSISNGVPAKPQLLRRKMSGEIFKMEHLGGPVSL